MAHSQIGYDPARIFPSSIATPATLTTTETDLFIITDGGSIQKSQLTVYARVTLGAVTSATFFYYYSPDNGTSWYPICLYNTGTGEITQRSVVMDSGSYATGGDTYFSDDVPVGACTQFKVTGKSASGTPTIASLKVIGRDN